MLPYFMPYQIVGEMKTKNRVSNALISRRPRRKRSNYSSYDEHLIDEFIDEHLGRFSLKKSKTTEEIQKETETEAMIAVSLGFPIDGLLEGEIKAEVVSELGGKEQNDYIVVRNHILVRWRHNVRMWITKAQIKETVAAEYEYLIYSAYDFLLTNGYINFGVSPLLTSRIREDSSEGSVIIVGAGLSGLAAARQLLSFGFRVVILEGRNRPGGRVYTQKMGCEGKYAYVDLGGSVITGIHANPLGVTARQLSIPLHKIRDKCPLYWPGGEPVDPKIDSKMEMIFNKLLDKVTQWRQIMGGISSDISLGSLLETLRKLYAVSKNGEERQLLDWHFANLEYANAGCLSQLSAAYWDQDDPFEMGGDHCLLSGGNWRLIKALCEGVPIFYKKEVDEIRYGDDGVEVMAGGQSYQADMVLCTVPLGVLKAKTIEFKPELPKRKLQAIERLGFGLLNKVALVFPYVFWGDELDTFGCLRDNSSKRGEFFLFYSYHTVSGGAVLIALVAGEAAHDFEHTDPVDLLHRVLSILRGIYTPRGISVPDPLQTACTRWGSDRFSHGSYSHVGINSSGRDYDTLGDNVGGRLFFAGEATNRQHPASMHGAFLSGLREASCIFHAAKDLQSNSRKCIQKSFGPITDVIGDLFLRPDLEFGNFSFIFNPLTQSATSTGIMRAIFHNPNMKPQYDENDTSLLSSRLHFYALLTREQAEQLEKVVGGPRDKLSYLLKDLGLKLMGLSVLGDLANSLILSIAGGRRGRGRNHTYAVK